MAARSRQGVVSEGASTGEIPPAPTDATLGKVEVADSAIAAIAVDAVLDCYGVVGLARPGRVRQAANGSVAVLSPGERRRGINVQTSGDQISIDLYVVVEYGMRISEVAHSIMTTVKFEVERALGMPVAQVNVNVQGLRFSTDT